VVELHVLRVFVNEDERHGNPLGVVLDGAAVPPAERQPLATELGYAETVFVDDRERGEIRIFTPREELGFAGHPCVGAAWLLGVDALEVPAGTIPVRHDGDVTWIAARPEWGPAHVHQELASTADVDGYPVPGSGLEAVWAWEGDGLIRSRVFPVDIGVAEDEATGSAATKLAAELGREITIRQGQGSIIHARPREDGMVEIGGRVVLHEVMQR
jgi:predicted PhzF superfamily epimerase YddE/YHI9